MVTITDCLLVLFTPQFGCDLSEKVMIWTEMEAFTRQVTQIGRSACGATAVINVLVSTPLLPSSRTLPRLLRQRLEEEAHRAAKRQSSLLAATPEGSVVVGLFSSNAPVT